MWYWWLSVVPVLALLMLVLGHSRPMTDYDAACARVDADLDMGRGTNRAAVPGGADADGPVSWSTGRRGGAAA